MSLHRHIHSRPAVTGYSLFQSSVIERLGIVAVLAGALWGAVFKVLS